MKKTIILICVIGIFLVGGCEKKQSSIQNVNTEETTRNISNQEKVYGFFKLFMDA